MTRTRKNGFGERSYRRLVQSEGLTAFEIKRHESDLQILAPRDVSSEADRLLADVRRLLLEYRAKDRNFFEAIEPVQVAADAPEVIRRMAESASAAGVGPMAGVAGAVAEYVGRGLLKYVPEIIVENGGDIFIKAARERRVLVSAGASELSNRFALRILPEDGPTGIATSSGTVGHSASFGRADAATVVCSDPVLADCLATALGNRARSEEDLDGALKWLWANHGGAGEQPRIRGAMVIVGKRMGVCGALRLAPCD